MTRHIERLSSSSVFKEEREELLDDDTDAPLAALCLSGGGIRSATFALGVLEALSRFDLLKEFHYLSTVSGGGYIGSWLTAWRSRAQDDSMVFAALDRTRSQTGAEADKVSALRANSNYLTPKLGVFSADTWAAAALVVRNLILNWLMFGPFFLSLLFLPKLAANLLCLSRDWDGLWRTGWFLAGLGFVVVGLAAAVRGRFQASGLWLKDRTFLILVLLPLSLASLSLTIAFNSVGMFPPMLVLGFSAGATTHLSILVLLGALYGGLFYLGAWSLGVWWWLAPVGERVRPIFRTWALRICRRLFPRNKKRRILVRLWVFQFCSLLLTGDGRANRLEGAALIRWCNRLGDFLAFILAGCAVGAFITIGFYLRRIFDLQAGMMVVLGPAWSMLAFAVGDLIFVGLNSFAPRGDRDREWGARYGGWLLAVAATFLVVTVIDLYMPSLLRLGWLKGSAYYASLGLSGVVTLALGPSKLTGATQIAKGLERFRISTLVSLAALIFAAFLAGLLSYLDDRLTYFIDSGLSFDALLNCGSSSPQMETSFLVRLSCFLMLALLAILVSYFVNVNRFSLHALYRNRLVRAFLGAARVRKEREPDPFSGFDQADNLHMSETLPPPYLKGRRLLHVVNMTLNVVASSNLAWQERKAEPFTVTALHSGNGRVGYRRTWKYGAPRGGITLGTAMAISGAAVSPNMGYHSSPLVGMLLSLFNLRLGWWLGNPRSKKFADEGPVPGLKPALQELAGMTNDTNDWIYLSDGGHFENLGIYEMVRRKCRFIVVSDAGCDPGCAFEDLGNAVRKIYIDLGASIDFHSFNIEPRKNPPVSGFYCAVGAIKYPGCSELGWLLYIKPGYHGAEPAHVRSYAIANEAFPHESTSEQWFSESQFEAYRALGAYITEMICTGGDGVDVSVRPEPMDLTKLMGQSARYLRPKRAV